MTEPVAAIKSAPRNTETWTPREAELAQASRSANTLRGYRADWREYSKWCEQEGFSALPSEAAGVSGYIAYLETAGAKVGTIARRLAAIRYAHTLAGHPNPCSHPRVQLVWEGIRRTGKADPDQAAPLMPPLLLHAVDALPAMITWAKRTRREPEPSLLGARDRALLMVGFVGALRRSELVGIDVEHLARDERGLVIKIPRSKTNQAGTRSQLIALPYAQNPRYCPVRLLYAWLDLASITTGPAFRGIHRSNTALPGRLTPGAANTSVKNAVQAALLRQGSLDEAPEPTADSYSAHSLRAGFVTYAKVYRGANTDQVKAQSRHRSADSVDLYTRNNDVWTNNAATSLGL